MRLLGADGSKLTKFSNSVPKTSLSVLGGRYKHNSFMLDLSGPNRTHENLKVDTLTLIVCHDTLILL